MAWPPVEPGLRRLPIYVDLTKSELRLRPSDPAFSYSFRKELEWLFELPRGEIERLIVLEGRVPKYSPAEFEAWWALPPEERPWDRTSALAGSQSVIENEARLAPTYIVRREDNKFWVALKKVFQPMSGTTPLFVDFVEAAMNFKEATLPPEKRGKLFRAYTA